MARHTYDPKDPGAERFESIRKQNLRKPRPVAEARKAAQAAHDSAEAKGATKAAAKAAEAHVAAGSQE